MSFFLINCFNHSLRLISPLCDRCKTIKSSLRKESIPSYPNGSNANNNYNYNYNYNKGNKDIFILVIFNR